MESSVSFLGVRMASRPQIAPTWSTTKWWPVDHVPRDRLGLGLREVGNQTDPGMVNSEATQPSGPQSDWLSVLIEQACPEEPSYVNVSGPSFASSGVHERRLVLLHLTSSKRS